MIFIIQTICSVLQPFSLRERERERQRDRDRDRETETERMEDGGICEVYFF